MSRLTKLRKNNKLYVSKQIDEKNEEGYCGDAIEKLAKFENLFDYLIMQQEEIPNELEVLRNEGRIKSYHFREIFAKKLIIDAFLNLMKKYDIE